MYSTGDDMKAKVKVIVREGQFQVEKEIEVSAYETEAEGLIAHRDPAYSHRWVLTHEASGYRLSLKAYTNTLTAAKIAAQRLAFMPWDGSAEVIQQRFYKHHEENIEQFILRTMQEADNEYQNT
jgi:hypothetical protein